MTYNVGSGVLQKMAELADEPTGDSTFQAGGWELNKGRSGRMYWYDKASNVTDVYEPRGGARVVTAPAPPDPPPATGTRSIIDIRHKLPRANDQNQEWRALSAITLLVYHWDGGPKIPSGYDPISYYQGEARFHIAKDWDGLGSFGTGLQYQYKISRDGRIWWTRSLEEIVWAATAANPFSINACFDATTGQGPTKAQLESGRWLANYLWTETPHLPNLVEGRINGHGELTQWGNSTACPGSALLALVRELRG